MRVQFLILLVLSLVAAGTFWYRTTASLCPVPLSYRIGTISPEFNVSEERVKQYLMAAETVWESATKKDLFYYDPKGTVVVNFVFDDRQATADSQSIQKAALDTKRAENQKVLDSLEQLQKDYETQSNAYKEKMKAYERRLNDYNERVNQYNDQGGAPQKEYAALEAEKRTLNKQSDDLNREADKLNTLAANINSLNQKSAELVAQYNSTVEAYNTEFGFSKEFTEGDYQSNTIRIYKYSSENEVTKVLAHELGHALGVDHVEGKSSVMYYLIEDTEHPSTLSAEDIAAYNRVCSGQDTFLGRLRAFIRNHLLMLNTYIYG